MEQAVTARTSRKRAVQALDFEASPDALVTVEQVALKIGFAVTTVREWARQGKYNFPAPQRHGRAVRWLARDVTTWRREEWGEGRHAPSSPFRQPA